ncbi:MAG: type II secretion system F family protein [Pseudomonadota bacterium]
MPRFKFRFVTTSGAIDNAILEAASYQDLLVSLQRENVQLIYARRLVLDVSPFWHKYWTDFKPELIDFCQFAAAMDRAGVALLDILSDARHVVQNKRLAQVLLEIRARIQEGAALSQALALFPYIFDSPFIQMIRISEQTGQLHQAFEHLVEHLEWEVSIKSNLHATLRYPLLVMLTLGVTFVALSNFLLPELQAFLIATQIQTAWHTQLLFYIFEHTADLLLVLFAPLILTTILCAFLRYTSQQFSLFSDRLVLRIPFLGAYLTHIALARFFHYFFSTFAAGIDVLQCLEVAIHFLSNHFLAHELSRVRLAIESGGSLAESFAKSSICCISTQRLLYAGETTGQLQVFLARIRNLHEAQSKRKVKFLIYSLGPCLLLLSGTFLMWIVMAIFQPLYTSFILLEP